MLTLRSNSQRRSRTTTILKFSRKSHSSCTVARVIAGSTAHFLPDMLPTSSLFSNSIGDAGARAIAEALKHNSSITSLKCVFRWKCCAASFVGDLFCDVVPFCCGPMLLRCVLWRASLAERFTFRPILLSTSSVYNNSIGEAGARAIAEALAHNSSITSLEWVFRWKRCAA